MIDAARDFATLQAFIVGRLSEDERRSFEDRLLREPALVKELEQSLRMREGLARLRASGHLTNVAPRRTHLRAWLPALAAAASVVLALFLWLPRAATPMPVLTASLEARAVAGTTSLVAAHFTFVSMRGSSVPDLELPPAGMIEIRAEPSTSQAGQVYRVSLVRQQDEGSAQTVASLQGLVVSADGYLHCYANAARLAAGPYALRIEPDDSAAAAGVQTFPFNLRPRATDPSR